MKITVHEEFDGDELPLRPPGFHDMLLAERVARHRRLRALNAPEIILEASRRLMHEAIVRVTLEEVLPSEGVHDDDDPVQ